MLRIFFIVSYSEILFENFICALERAITFYFLKRGSCLKNFRQILQRKGYKNVDEIFICLLKILFVFAMFHQLIAGNMFRISGGLL